MKEGWKYKKIGDVCASITDGSHNPPQGIEHSAYRMISSQNIFDDELRILDDNVRFISEDNHIIENKRTRLSKGVVLLTIVGTIGRSCVLNGEEGYLTLQRSVAALHPSSDILSRYLMHCLIGNRRKLEKEAHGIAQRGIYLKQLAALDIPVPSLEIQQSIIDELDIIRGLIKTKQCQLNDLDLLAQSLFYDMFGDPVENEKRWDVKKLSEISSLICNGNTPKGGSEVYVKKGYLFLRSQNVWKNRLELDDVAYIDEETHSKLKKSVLMHNDLLITKTGRINTENSSLGRAALFEGEDRSANINGHVYLVRLKENMVHKFVLYILISNSYRELIRKTCVGGIDKRQLNRDHIEDFPIIFPPLDMQKLYVKKIEKIEQQKVQLNSTISDLETMLASRMQYWFD